MLPFAIKGPDGQYRFKMREMAQNSERLERAQAFWRIIEKHVDFGFTASLRLSDIKRAIDRFIVLDSVLLSKALNVDEFRNGYKLGLYYLLFNLDRLKRIFDFDKVIPPGSKVDLIFDQRDKERASIIATWEDFATRNEMALDFSVPRFERDEDFLPLQAADLLCWFTREWDEASGDISSATAVLPWKPKADIPHLSLYLTEDDIFELIARVITRDRPDVRVFDRATMVLSRCTVLAMTRPYEPIKGRLSLGGA